MKKLSILIALISITGVYAQDIKEDSCQVKTCNTENSQCESLDIPVFIVDGVEVQEISDISPDDIEKVEIIKDPNIIRIFSPRLGGVVLITTKSKKYLKPVLSNYEQLTEQARQQRLPGELLIR